MATKRSGGSNVGLIVTLVGFVLLSVIVSVLAYMGFDGQAKLKTEKDAAVAEAKKQKDKAEWHKFQADVLRSYIGDVDGKPAVAADKQAALQEEKRRFDGGTDLPGAGEEGKTFRELVGKLNEELPWKADTSVTPSKTFVKRLAEQDAGYAALASAKKTADDDKQGALDLKQAAEKDRDAAIAGQNKLRKSSDEDTTTYTNWANKTDKAIADNLKAADERDTARAGKTAVEGEKVKLDKQMKALQGRVEKATSDLKAARDELEDTKSRLAALAERSGIDPRVMSAELLDANAARVLRNWDRNWQVVAIDKKGTMPYINLGSADGLKPQVTFSVHATGTDGKLIPTPKATVEVVRIISPNQAQVRITSIKDAKVDPVLKGDKLFNPTWDPFRPRHVAIAGLADLGDGTDGTEDLRRLLARQSVIVDAYVDTRDEKGPRTLRGEKKDGKDVAGEITTNTDYLILADNMEQVRHARAGNKAYVTEFDNQVKKLKAAAAANGVPVISLRKYLDMIGYRPTKLSATGTGR